MLSMENLKLISALLVGLFCIVIPFLMLSSCSKEIPDDLIEYPFELKMKVWLVGDAEANTIQLDKINDAFNFHQINFSIVQFEHIEKFDKSIAKELSSNNTYNVFVVPEIESSGGLQNGNWLYVPRFNYKLVAHELGHNLGLLNLDEDNNMMNPYIGQRYEFNIEQGAKMRNWLNQGKIEVEFN